MIGLDTNVIVRYVMQDDVGQSARASALVDSLREDRRGFVSLVVLAEVHWVLRRAYRVSPSRAADVVRGLLDAAEVEVAEADSVRRALVSAEEGDFTDALVAELGSAAGCAWTATFDQQASRLPGMRLVPA
jgi:predicted nucleic-acid-binding protein